jgi:hypothetical protein
MNILKNRYFNYYFYILFVLLLFTNVITDAIVTYSKYYNLGLNRLGIISRGLISLFIIMIILKSIRVKKFNLLLICIMLFLPLGTFSFTNINDISVLKEGYIIFFKLSFVFILYFGLETNIKHTKYLFKIAKFIDYTFLIYFVVILFGLLFNIDMFRTYSDGFRAGFKGIIVAQNEGSLFMLLGVMWYYTRMLSKDISYVYFLISIIATIAYGTKVTILGLIIILFVFIFYKYKTIKAIILSMQIFSIITISLFFLYTKFELIKNLFDLTIQYFLSKLDQYDIFTVLLSGRNEKFITNFNEALVNSPYVFFMGGFPITNYFVEIDILDMIFFCGIFSTFIYLLFYYKMFFDNLKYSKYKINNFILFYFVLLISSTGGHVFYSLLNAPILSFMIFYYKYSYTLRSSFEKNLTN